MSTLGSGAWRARTWDRGALIGVAAASAMVLGLAPVIVYLPWMQAVALVLGLLTAGLMLLRPYAAVLAFLALRTLLDMLWWTDIQVAGWNLLQAGSGAMIAMGFVLLLLRARQLRHHPMLPAVIGFVAFVGLAAVRATSIGDGMKLVAELTSPWILLLLVSALANSPARRLGVMLTIAVSSLVPIGLGLYHLVQGTAQFELHGYMRLLGAYSNLHNHAIIMGSLVPLGLMFLIATRKAPQRVLATLFVLGAGTCLYFTYVRTALLALAVFGVVFLVLERRWRTLLLLAPLFLVFLGLSTTMQDRFADLVTVFEADDQIASRDDLGSGRWRLWREAWATYVRSGPAQWVIGGGLGSHWYSTFRVIDPHSDILSLLLQTGPLGVLLYLGMMAHTAWRGLRVRLTAELPFERTYASFAAALMLVMLVSMSISNAHVTRPSAGWYVWALVGVLFAIPPSRGQTLDYQDNRSRGVLGHNPR